MTTTTIHDLRCIDCRHFEESPLPSGAGKCTAWIDGVSDSGVQYVLNVNATKSHTMAEYDDATQMLDVSVGCMMFEPTSAALKRARSEARYLRDPHKFNGVHPNKS